MKLTNGLRMLATLAALALSGVQATPARGEAVFVPIDDFTAATTPVMAGPGLYAPYAPSHVYVTPPVALPPLHASGWMQAWPAHPHWGTPYWGGPAWGYPYATEPRSYRLRERMKW